MVYYLILYDANSGLELFSLKNHLEEHRSLLITGFLTAITQFMNSIIDSFGEKIEDITSTSYIFKNILVLEEFGVNLLVIYDKQENNYISELTSIITNIIRNNKGVIFENPNHTRNYEIIKELIKDYLVYWKKERLVKGKPIPETLI